MSDAAVEAVRKRDVAVVCVGNHPEGNASWELVTSPSEGKEGVDRKEITLPPGQEDFVRRVQAANPHTVVVLITSFPVALPWAATNATTILHMTHASQESATRWATCCSGTRSPAAGSPRPGPRPSRNCRP